MVFLSVGHRGGRRLRAKGRGGTGREEAVRKWDGLQEIPVGQARPGR